METQNRVAKEANELALEEPKHNDQDEDEEFEVKVFTSENKPFTSAGEDDEEPVVKMDMSLNIDDAYVPNQEEPLNQDNSIQYEEVPQPDSERSAKESVINKQSSDVRIIIDKYTPPQSTSVTDLVDRLNSKPKEVSAATTEQEVDEPRQDIPEPYVEKNGDDELVKVESQEEMKTAREADDETNNTEAETVAEEVEEVEEAEPVA